MNKQLLTQHFRQAVMGRLAYGKEQNHATRFKLSVAMWLDESPL